MRARQKEDSSGLVHQIRIEKTEKSALLLSWSAMLVKSK